MPTIFSHGIAALSASTLFKIKSEKILFYFLVLFFSILPDLDVVAFYFGIPYSHPFGHRGFTHSILFSILIPLPFLYLFYRNKNLTLISLLILWISFFLSSLSHALLDALTNGGLGVCLFYPISTERFFFSFRPIQVSPIGKRFFSDAGLRVLKSEFIWIWIPSLLGFVFIQVISKLKMLSVKRND